MKGPQFLQPMEVKHPIEHIKRFAKLTPELEELLMSAMIEKRFRKGEIITGAVNIAPFSYYIKSGSARVFVVSGGKEHTQSFTFDNEYILVTHYSLEAEPDTVAIQFLEPTEVIYVPHERIKVMLESSADIESTSALLFLNTAMIHYLGHLEERLYVMQTMSAPQRYQWVLKRHPRIHEIASVTQLASYLGLTKETLYRIRNNKY